MAVNHQEPTRNIRWITKIKKNKHVNEKTGEELLTRSSLALSGSSCKVTAQLGLTLLLKIAVDSPVAVVFDCVWVVTRTVLKDWGTVSSSSTSIVQCLLKSLVTHPIFTYAISSTYSTEPRTRKSVTWQKPLWFSDLFSQIETERQTLSRTNWKRTEERLKLCWK